MFRQVTTWVGVIGVLILIALVTAVIVGKIDASEFAIVTGSVIPFMGAVLIWANDKNKQSQQNQ